MCFSATGSFALAGVLTGVGAVSLGQHQSRVFRLLAAAPLLFAAQQAAEGIVWLTLGETTSALHTTAVNAFLGFALVVWPVYLPFSLWLAERRPGRRRALVALGVVGAIVSATAWVLLAQWQPAAHAVGNSMHYQFASVDLPGREFTLVVAYVLPTVVPFFVSSATLTRTIGLTTVVALLVTALVERETLTSVWCFFAAILSAQLLLTVRRESRAQGL